MIGEKPRLPANRKAEQQANSHERSAPHRLETAAQ